MWNPFARSVRNAGNMKMMQTSQKAQHGGQIMGLNAMPIIRDQHQTWNRRRLEDLLPVDKEASVAVL